MSSTSDFFFNNLGRIGSDTTDNTQRNISNSKYSSYILEDLYGNNLSDNHVNFATSAPTINFRGSGGGAGIPSTVIENDSELVIKGNQERNLERLQLLQRPYITVPYLGRGSVNPDVESILLQGEQVHDVKSTSTIMDKSFIDYSTTPLMGDVQARVTNPVYSIEEVASQDWVRGGVASREQFRDGK
jgi:hypothetical protein